MVSGDLRGIYYSARQATILLVKLLPDVRVNDSDDFLTPVF
jgi:hypothetical protein